MTNRFRRGSGCFPCGACGRLTRDTSDGNGNVGLCPECYEVAGLENEISDHGDPDGKLAKLVDELNEQCKAKGGKL